MYVGSPLINKLFNRDYYSTLSTLFFIYAIVRSSNISVRLVSPYSGVDFLGRVEVLYNGQWGTICDRYFRTADANVICGMAGFSEAICTVHNAGFGRGYYSTLLGKLKAIRY